MKLSHLELILSELFPSKYAVEGDKIGLQVNCGDNIVNNIHVAYELTDEVINESISLKTDLLIVFHPLIYKPLSEVTFNDRVGNLIIKLIRNNISLYVIHTIYDTNPKGTNYLIAEKLGLKKVSNLIDYFPEEDIGMGFVGYYENPINAKQFLELCHNTFSNPIRYCSCQNKFIKKVVLIGGSGSSFLNSVLRTDTDAFITADNSYHTFHRLKGKIWLIDPGHYEMEQFVAKGIFNVISAHIPKTVNKLTLSSVNTNPVDYFTNE